MDYNDNWDSLTKAFDRFLEKNKAKIGYMEHKPKPPVVLKTLEEIKQQLNKRNRTRGFSSLPPHENEDLPSSYRETDATLSETPQPAEPPKTKWSFRSKQVKFSRKKIEIPPINEEIGQSTIQDEISQNQSFEQDIKDEGQARFTMTSIQPKGSKTFDKPVKSSQSIDIIGLDLQFTPRIGVQRTKTSIIRVPKTQSEMSIATPSKLEIKKKSDAQKKQELQNKIANKQWKTERNIRRKTMMINRIVTDKQNKLQENFQRNNIRRKSMMQQEEVKREEQRTNYKQKLLKAFVLKNIQLQKASEKAKIKNEKHTKIRARITKHKTQF